MSFFVGSWALGMLICLIHIIHVACFDHVMCLTTLFCDTGTEYVQYIGVTVRSEVISVCLSVIVRRLSFTSLERL